MITNEDFMIMYKKQIVQIFNLLKLIIVIFAIGIFGNFTSDPNHIWFQRSGSLIVILSVFAEILHSNIKRISNEILIDYGDKNPRTFMEEFKKTNNGSNKFTPNLNIILEPLIIGLAILGTIIWGYGDLIYLFIGSYI